MLNHIPPKYISWQSQGCIYDLWYYSGGKPQSEQSFFYYFEEIKQQTNVINLKRQIFPFEALNCVLCAIKRNVFEEKEKKYIPFPYAHTPMTFHKKKVFIA